MRTIKLVYILFKSFSLLLQLLHLRLKCLILALIILSCWPDEFNGTKTLNSAWKTFAKNTNSRELLRCLSAVSTQSNLTGIISFELFFLRRERGSSEMNSIFTSNSLHGHYNAPCVCVCVCVCVCARALASSWKQASQWSSQSHHRQSRCFST